MPRERLDLTGFVPVPAWPAYLIHPDGRVATLKARQPRLLAVDDSSWNPKAWAVQLSGERVRIHQLLYVLFGDTTAFSINANAILSTRPGYRFASWDDLDGVA